MAFLLKLFTGPSAPAVRKDFGFPLIASTLAQAPEKEQREAILEKQAFLLWEASVDWPAVDPRQFAQMHLSSYLRGLSLDGSDPILSAEFWRNFIHLWMSGKGIVIPFDISAEQLHLLAEEIEFYHHLLTTAKECENPDNMVLFFQECIHKQLGAKGRCYVPFGYRGGVNRDGHAIPCLFEKKKNRILVHVLNQGAGSEVHPLIDIRGTQFIRVYRHPPIVIEEAVFFGELGRSFLKRQFFLKKEAPLPGAEYDPEDVIGPLLIMGVLQDSYETSPELTSGKPQTANTCGDKAVRLVNKDCLEVHLGVPTKERKRFFFNAKLCSLLVMAHDLEKDALSMERCDLIDRALREFSIATQKRKDDLHEEELLLCHSLIQSIQKRLAVAKAHLGVPLRLLPPLEDVHPIGAIPTEQPPIPPIPLSQPIDPPWIDENFIPIRPFTPETFLLNLKECHAFLEAHPQGASTLTSVSIAMSSLPIPSAEGADVWDAISEDQIPECLLLLKQCLWEIRKPLYENMNARFIDSFLIIHTAYAIADKLARRLPQNRLEGFFSPYVLHQLPFEHLRQPFAIPLAEDNRRLAQIQTYFSLQEKRCPHAAFHFDRQLPFGSALRTLRDKNPLSNRTEQALAFLSQHLLFAYDHGLDQALTRAQQYKELWSRNELLPPCVGLLRELSFAAYSSFIGWAGPPGEYSLCFQLLNEGDKAILEVPHLFAFPENHLFSHPNFHLPHKLAQQAPLFPHLQPIDSAHYIPLRDSGSLLSTNAAYCLPPSAGLKDISSATYQELMAIRCVKNLQVVQAIEWSKKNMPLMENRFICAFIEETLLALGVLSQQLADEPSFIEPMRAWVCEGIDICGRRGNDIPTTLFFLQIGYYIEIHAPENPDQEQLIASYRQVLHQLLKHKDLHIKGETSIRETLLLTYCHYTVFTPPLIDEILCVWFQTKDLLLHLQDRKWKHTAIQRLLCRMQLELRLLLEDPTSRNRLCDSILTSLLPLATSGSPWISSAPFVCEQGPYTLNFLNGSLLIQNHPAAFSFNPKVVWNSIYDNDICTLLGSPDELICDDGIFKHKNGNFSLVQRGGAYPPILRGRFSWKGEPHWFVYIPREDRPKKAPWEGRGGIWKLDGPDAPSDYYVTTVSRCPTLISRISLHHGQSREVLLNAQGEETPLVSADMEEWSIQAKALGSHPYTRLWVDTASNQIARFEFLDLGLCFEAEETGHGHILRCKKHPSYWLASQQEIPELPGFHGLLVLVNETQEKMVILPDERFLSLQSSDFSSTACFQSQLLPPHSRNPYFAYQMVGGRLHHDSPQANLLLVELFAGYRRYEEAWHYLQKTRAFSLSHVQKCEIRLERLEDRCPEALAFFLRAALFLLEEWDQILSDPLHLKERIKSHPDFWVKVSRSYHDYLNVLGSIPAYFLLDAQEEIRLLEALQKQRSQKNDLLDLRHEHLTSRHSLNFMVNNTRMSPLPPSLAKLECHPLPHHLPGLPPILVANLSLGSFVRAQNGTLFDNLNPLVMEILSASSQRKAPVDLDLLYLAKSNLSEREKDFLVLLFQLRRFSSHFKDLYKALVSDLDPDQLDWMEILSRLHTLQGAHPPTKELSVFVSTKSISIKTPHIREDRPLRWPTNLLAQPLVLPPIFATETLFELRKAPVAIADQFCLAQEVSQAHSPIERYLYEQLHLGHEKNKATSKVIYTLKASANLLHVKQTLLQQVPAQAAHLARLRIDIETLANKLPTDEPHPMDMRVVVQDSIASMRRLGRISSTLSLETHLIPALLNRRVDGLLEINPHLGKAECARLLCLLKQYLHQSILLDHQREIIKLIGSLEQSQEGAERRYLTQRLGQTIDWQYAYDEAYPQLAVYQYLAKKRLLPDQAEVLRWIFESGLKQHLLFAFRAGGGKTSVLLTILMLMAEQEGFVPISIAPHSNYTIERDNQCIALQTAFNQRLFTLEIGLEEVVSPQRWKEIYEQLTNSGREKRAFIFTPETYHAIYLKYLLALEAGDEERVQWLSLIVLDFFPKKCKAFIDECHRNLDPLTQADLGIGSLTSLSPDHRTLLCDLYKPILGLSEPPLELSDHRPMHEVIRLSRNEQAALPSKDIEEICYFLAPFIATHPLLALTPDQTQQITPFWLDRRALTPPFFETLEAQSPEKADLIRFIRFCLTELLPFTLKQVGGITHGSPTQEDLEGDTPRYRTDTSLDQYKDPFVTSTLSLQGIYQRGLNEKQVRKLVEKLQSLHIEQQAALLQGGQTAASTLFGKWLGNGAPALMELSANGVLPPSLRNLSHHVEAIDWYLRHVLLPGIRYAKEHLVSTPAHLMGGFHHCTVFSATPGLPQLYLPTLSKNDTAFQESVASKLCLECNKGIVLDHFEPAFFFEEAYQKDPDLFPRCRAIIDAGGAMRGNFSMEDTARAFLQFASSKNLPYDGVLFYDKEAANTLVFWGSLEAAPWKLQGSDVVSQFEQRGLKWDKMRVLVLFDPSHTTASNIPLSADAVGLLLIAEELVFDDLVQAVMRLRLFLQEQEIRWGIPSYMRQLLPADLSSRSIVQWAIRNLAKKLASSIPSASFSQIEHRIQEEARIELRDHLKNPRKQISTFQKHRNGFIHPYSLSHAHFGRPIQPCEALNVLWKFAEDCYRTYGFTTPWHQTQNLQHALMPLINSTGKMIDSLPSIPHDSLAKATRMHCFQQQEEQVQHRAVGIVDVAAAPFYGDLPSLGDPYFHEQLQKRSRFAQDLFGTHKLCPGLYYTENASETALLANKPLGIRYLKPLSYILLFPNDKMAYALSNEEAALFRHQLLSGKGKVARPIFLINTQGWIVQKGRGSFSADPSLYPQLLETSWLQDLLTDVSLLQGKLLFPERLRLRLQNWEDFWPFWERICSSVNPGRIQKNNIEALVPPALKKSIPAQPVSSAQKHSSKFFSWFS